jgi:hypothetical protein
VQALSRQLKDKHSTLAIAAVLWAETNAGGASIGQMYLEGKDAIEQKRIKIDDRAEEGISAQIYESLEGVYQTADALKAAAEAARGIYAKLQLDGVGGVADAVRLATGGIETFNGGKIALPRGWGARQFRDAMGDAIPKAIKAAGGAFIFKGQTLSAEEFAKQLPGARLQTWGRNSYLVMSGNEVARHADGTPYVLTVDPKRLQIVKPSIAQTGALFDGSIWLEGEP